MALHFGCCCHSHGIEFYRRVNWMCRLSGVRWFEAVRCGNFVELFLQFRKCMPISGSYNLKWLLYSQSEWKKIGLERAEIKFWIHLISFYEIQLKSLTCFMMPHKIYRPTPAIFLFALLQAANLFIVGIKMQFCKCANDWSSPFGLQWWTCAHSR